MYDKLLYIDSLLGDKIDEIQQINLDISVKNNTISFLEREIMMHK